MSTIHSHLERRHTEHDKLINDIVLSRLNSKLLRGCLSQPLLIRITKPHGRMIMKERDMTRSLKGKRVRMCVELRENKSGGNKRRI